jgi:predicted RNA-binding protein (virulence factor B family)
MGVKLMGNRETLYVGMPEKTIPVHISVWVDKNDALKFGIKADKNHRLSATFNLMFPFNEPREICEKIKHVHSDTLGFWRGRKA